MTSPYYHCRQMGGHNCIPISRFIFLRRWLCVRCGSIYKGDTR